MEKILLIEDNPNIQIAVEGALGNTFEVKAVSNGTEAREILKKEAFSLLLLDVNLPGEDGYHLLTQLRSQNIQTPVIFLTGQKAISDKMMAFSLGAEDFIEKPFHPTELKIRIEARLRKNKEAMQSFQVIHKGGIELNLESHSVRVKTDGGYNELDLTPNEFKLISYLLKNDDKVFTRKDLVKKVLGDVVVTERTIDSHINRLRQKLGPYGFMIQSIRGKGYKFSLTEKKKAA